MDFVDKTIPMHEKKFLITAGDFNHSNERHPNVIKNLLRGIMQKTLSIEPTRKKNTIDYIAIGNGSKLVSDRVYTIESTYVILIQTFINDHRI